MPIGRKIGSLASLKSTLKSSSSHIRYIPKDGSITVRFLEEPEEWVNYLEHYDEALRKSYPCIEEGSCPGCTTNERKSSRYLANALDVEQDKVIAIQMPKDLVSRLVNRYEKYDTMMDRDYELSRTGSGLDTTYDAEGEPPMTRKLTKYKLLDLTDVLDESYQSLFGTNGAGAAKTDEDEPKKPVRKRTPSAAAPSRRKTKFEPEDEDEEEELDDEEVEDEDDEEEEVEDDEEESEDEDEEEEGEYYTEAELTAMSLGELRALAKEYGIAVTGMKKAQIVEAILGGDEEDEDEPF